MLKVYLATVNVLGGEKIHVVTAESKEHVQNLVKDFWFSDSSLEIKKIKEINDHRVVITRHNEE